MFTESLIYPPCLAKAPTFLQTGDIVALGIARLGQQQRLVNASCSIANVMARAIVSGGIARGQP